jgi:zinc and cadmium transporter
MNAPALLTVYCVAILLASIAGGWIPLVLQPTHIRLQTYLSFASGIMLGAALYHMLPEASEAAPGLWPHWTVVGLLTLFFLERFFAFHHHEVPNATELGGDELPHPAEHGDHAGHGNHAGHVHSHAHPHEHETHTQSPLAWSTALVGLSVHTLTGGFALASAVEADANQPGPVGLSVFLATLLHKPADSLTITSLMVSEGAQRRWANLVNFLFALIIPIGAALFYVAKGLIAQPSLAFSGGALAFSAGTFLSIALGDLMPELQFHRHDRVRLSLALVAGVAVMYLSAMIEG